MNQTFDVARKYTEALEKTLAKAETDIKIENELSTLNEIYKKITEETTKITDEFNDLNKKFTELAVFLIECQLKMCKLRTY
jgi:hypothetical protein